MNVLITADIHLGIYSDYNYKHNARLDQFDKLANRLVELGKENNCEECWILGDFLRVPNCNSLVQHKLKNFLDILSDYFITIRYILGQHDLQAKSDTMTLDDTIVDITGNSRFIYMDKKILNLNGHRIAFANWTPSQDLSWIDGKVDILCGHYTKSVLFGQEIDESKFDLMIHGDIHNDQVIGKFISVGNPIQHDYSSQPEGTCIILNIDTLDWIHVKIDPDHTRFLRLFYTDNQAEEGFHDELNYYKFKPAISNTNDSNGELVIQWKDIDDLITNTLLANNLLDIHDEIKTKNIHSNEINFNLELISLDITGYRSVTQFHIDFDRNDRIILLGENGSGKSSVINALKSVFEKSRYMAYEKSDLTDTQLVTIKFMYQNNLIEITKGDYWKLVIDGTEIHYNNKTEFENDLIDRYPFIQYLDIFFIASGSSNLSNQLNSARRVELISKFYRLDYVTNCSDIANEIYQEKVQALNDLSNTILKNSGALDAYNKRLSELESLNLGDYKLVKGQLDNLRKLRDDYLKFKEWQSDKKTYLATWNEVNDRINSLKSRLNIDPEKTQIRLNELAEEIEKLKDLLEQKINESNNLKKLNELLKDQTERGIAISKKLDLIKLSKCPECGSNLITTKSLELISKYQLELDNARKSYDDTIEKLNKFTDEEKQDNYYLTYISKIKSMLKEKDDEKLILSNKLEKYKVSKSDLEVFNEKLVKIESKLSELESIKPEEVTLPIDLNDQELNLTSKLAQFDEKINLLDKVSKLTDDQNKLNEQYNDNKKLSDRYLDYCSLMSRNGIVMAKILSKLAEQFSAGDIKYQVEDGVFRGNRYINFNSLYKVKSKWRLYESLSDGQKQVCDLDFLNNLFSIKIGFLVLDEYLRHLDDNNFPKCMDLLMKMNVDVIIMSTHDPNITAYTKKYLLSLDETGATQFVKV